jgi:hypothetical protein
MIERCFLTYSALRRWEDLWLALAINFDMKAFNSSLRGFHHPWGGRRSLPSGHHLRGTFGFRNKISELICGLGRMARICVVYGGGDCSGFGAKND